MERPPLFAQRAPTSKIYPLLLLFSKRDLSRREAAAKRAHFVRVCVNKRLNHAMLTDHRHELRPASFPVYHRTKASPPVLPRSLPNMGWKRNPSHMIRLDLPIGALFPVPHSPPVLHSSYVQALRCRTLIVTGLPHPGQIHTGSLLPLTFRSAPMDPYLTILLAILQPPSRRP